jgi:hypothetical protein
MDGSGSVSLINGSRSGSGRQKTYVSGTLQRLKRPYPSRETVPLKEEMKVLIKILAKHLLLLISAHMYSTLGKNIDLI